MIIEHPNKADAQALWALWQEAFGDTEAFWQSFCRAAFSPRRCLVAREDGKLAAALYWFDCSCRGQKLAYVYGVATAKAFRGRGICHSLMDALHSRLKAAGYVGAALVPGSQSLIDLYGAMGYAPFCGMEEISCAPGQPVKLQPISFGEYGILRAALLPPGAIVQENENLAFLAAQAELYRGESFLLAARKEDDRLLTLELLGDESAASGIVAALGCREGRFRRFGSGKVFGMYRPLTSAPPPTYFALAFD